MKIIHIILFQILFSSCNGLNGKRELYGYYAPVNYNNNFDTIQLKRDGLYLRKVYDKNKKLLLEVNGKWQLENNLILHFEHFYLNLDDDLERFPELANDRMSMTTYFEFQNNVIQFCVGYNDKEENCYQKIE